MGHDINEYKLVSENIQSSSIEREAKDVHFERSIRVFEEDLLLEKKLNREQRKAYTVIVDRIFSNKAGAFFIDGPGGTGKSFLYRSLLAAIRSRGFVALATTSSGVAASILPGGRTAHSRFKIPINVDENISCNINKQSSLACLIRDAKLIVWDEASMAKAKTIEAFNLLLKDLMDTRMLFGGKVVVLGGDFRQTLPVVLNGKKEDFISQKDKVEIPNSLLIPFATEEQSLQELFNVTYPNIESLFHDSSSLASHVILTTKNDYVHEINDMLISKFPNTARSFIVIDETVEPNDQSQFEDYLHTLNPTNLPPYKFTLKEIAHFKTHVISAKIASGDFQNKHVFIPRIPLLASEDEKLSIPFKRTQFPIRLCFAMTINKAQGQTLDFVGIYLREPVFSHGQLYVALSRAKTSKAVKLLIRPLTSDSNDDHLTYNIDKYCCAGSHTYVHERVYDEFIEKVKVRVMRPVVGDPFREGVEQEQFQKILRYIREGHDSSATLECRDDTIGSKGYSSNSSKL
ncbi:hypothetical protein H5410_038898 [Solanum commersonii]|uniref:ATP-dependent DNA helicase n=1 Tax=Solanum commersonii TaxID=4109 RepID=A0A9J5YBX3_SOLCO|nr:hypothetical protein H5410_038898 [Solanum commersonii]